ncbi:N-6 DNA methylase, partial [Jhaorihella thermophila]
MLGELIDLIANISTRSEQGQERDLFGRVYEYFLKEFAGSEGKRGGEFYTPPLGREKRWSRCSSPGRAAS